MKHLLIIVIAILIYQHWSQVDAAELNQKHGADVVMYTTAWCGYCAQARDMLNAQGIQFKELDVEKSAAASAEMKSVGGHGVPVIVVNGEVIKGFDRQRLQTLVSIL